MAITAQMRTEVTQLYTALFMRAPDAEGLGFWVTELNNPSATLATIAQGMYDTAPARAYYPLFLTDEEVITTFYTNVLGRTPDDEGKAFWTAALGEPGATKGSVIASMIAAVVAFPSTGSAAGLTSQALFNNRVIVAEYYAETMMGGISGAAAAISAVTATSDVSSTAAIEALIATGGGITSAGQTFSLTANADVIPGLLGSAGTTSNAGDNSIYSTETSLSSGDNLNGGAGNDTLHYASSGALVISESGFATTSVENAVVTSDAVGGTTFDTTGMTGLTSITNSNSSQNTTFIGGTALLGLTLANNGAPTHVAPSSFVDTTVTYNAATVVGTADKQAVTLNNNKNVDGTTIGFLTVQGIEEFNVTTTGGASLLDGIVSAQMKKMTVVGDQSLTLGNATFNDNAAVNVLDASGLTGTAALNVTIGANTATLDIAVTGGAGNDRANFSVGTGFDTNDAFNGGAGRDTLALTQGFATAQTTATGGTVTNVEILEITDGGTGNINMDAFPGVDTVFYSGLTGAVPPVALTAATTITNAVTGLTVQVNVDKVGQDSTTTLKTNGTTDVINYVFNKVGNPDLGVTTDNLGTVSAAQFETVNITTADDPLVLGVGTLNIANLTNTVATKLTIAGNANLVIVNSNDPVVPVLATIDASAATAPVTISGTNLASGGATVTLGSANDIFNVATAAGADTYDLSKGGNDTIVYTAVAQSTVAMDTVKSFVSGSDAIDLRTFVAPIISSSQFKGVKASFGEAQGALTAGGAASAVFDASSSMLWVDNNGDGTLDSRDFRVKLDGVTSITAADLKLGVSGNAGIVLTAATVPVVNLTSSNAVNSALTTNNDDTITSAASTALVGTAAALDGGLGSDTLNATLATQGLLTTLVAGGATGVALTSVEKVNLTVTASTAAVNLGTNIPATLTNLTVTGTDNNAALTVTTNANGQTVVVNNTTLAAAVPAGIASTITVGNFSSNSVTTGSADDTVVVTGGAATTSLTVNTGTGADTVRLDAATALTGTGNTFNGGTQITGTIDTLAINYDVGATGGFDFAALATAGTVAEFEAVTIINSDNSAHAVTLADGITRLTVDTSNAAEIFNVSATAAQANALTNFVDTTGTGDLNLLISTAGTVSLSGDTTTNITAITYQDVAVALTLNNTAQAVTQGGVTPGSATQSVVFGSGAAAQSATTNSTGTVDFSVAVGATVGGITMASVAAATTTLNITGTTGATFDVSSLVTTNANLDVIKVGAVTAAQTFTFGAGTSATVLQTNTAGVLSGPTVNAAETGSAVAYTFITDTGNVATHALSISGFNVGAGADVLDFSTATVITTQTGIVTTGAAATQAAAGSFAHALVLSGAAFQVGGSGVVGSNLAATGNAGAVEAAIIAAGITLAAQTATQGFYAVLDNGVSTGVYQVTLAGTAGTVGVIDNVADFSVVLVAQLTGVADCGTLNAANIV